MASSSREAACCPFTPAPWQTWHSPDVAVANYYTIRLTVDTTKAHSKRKPSYISNPICSPQIWPRYVSAGPYTNSGMALATNPDGTTRMVLEGPRQGLRGAELYLDLTGWLEPGQTGFQRRLLHPTGSRRC